MRKFKVVRKWPGGPEVSKELVVYNGNAEFCWEMGQPGMYPIKELEGFVEEIKEPESVWYLESNGVVYESEGDSGVPSWLRFRTKDSAEKFAKVLKDTHPYTFHGSCREFYELCEALNDRVK